MPTQFFALGGDPVDIQDVKNMIISNVARLKKAGANLTHEAIGVELEVSVLKTLLNTHNAAKVIALFGVDQDGVETYSTVVLVAKDAHGNFIKNGAMDIVATERWDRYRPACVLAASTVDLDGTCLNTLFV